MSMAALRGAQQGATDGEVDCKLISAPSERLNPEIVRRLSRLDPLVSTAHIAMEWALVFAAIALCTRYFHPLLYLLTVAFIGARQHSLLMLMHEGAHYRLFRSRRLNDWVGEVIVTWPLLVITMRGYRLNHLPHHRHLNADLDPDWVAKQNDEWQFPMPASRLGKLLLLDLCGIGFVKLLRKARALPKVHAQGADQRAMRVARPLYFAILLGLLWSQGWLYGFLLFWLVPFLTWFQVCAHVRSIAEHFAIEGRHGFYAGTRSTERGILDRLFVLSNDGSFHAEHHLYPSVPVYRLRELHSELMALPDYAKSIHVSRGYLHVLRECVAPRSRAGAP